MHETSIQSASIAHDARPCVLVVSDVILYREGVARGLELAGRHRVAATSAEDSALATLTCSHVDVVLLDASDVSALHTAQTLRDAHPTLPVIGFGGVYSTGWVGSHGMDLTMGTSLKFPLQCTCRACVP